MNVAGLLKIKGTDVATTTAETPVMEAVDQLKRKGIGAVVVIDDGGGVAGILSERDVVHALADRRDLAKAKVSDLMTKKVATCSPSATVNEVMQTMTEGRFRHLPVQEDGKLCGLVSIGDVVKSRIEELQRESEALQSYIASG